MASRAAAVVRKVVPLADRILIRKIEQQAKSAGGILLPDTGKKTNEGEVVAAGPGALDRNGKLVPMYVAVGDKVLLPEYGGHTIKVGDEELQLYRAEDILAKYVA